MERRASTVTRSSWASVCRLRSTGTTTFGVTYGRDYEFAFEAVNPYFVDNSPGLFVRRAVGGKFDVLGNVARHRYAYQHLVTQTAQFAATPKRVETTDNYGVNLGYRL